jgi:murein L,D-transpeptidase YcbB/YkuD
MLRAPMPTRAPLLFALLAGSLAIATPAARAQEMPSALRTLAGGGEIEGLRWPRFARLVPDLVALYDARASQPLWLDDDGDPSRAAKRVIEALGRAHTHALDPSDYDVDWLAAEAERLDDLRRPTPEEIARFDVSLTVALMRHLSDVHAGRVDPRTMHFDYDREAKRLDLPALALRAASERRPANVVASVRPPLAELTRLEAQLERHRELAADPALVPPAIDIGPKRRKIETGGALPEAADLARWLVALGDLDAGDAVPALYEGALVAAVARFQTRHGLEPDGVIGAATAKALAVPLAARVRQIELSIERLRWIPPLAGRAILVNVPAFELAGFDEVTPDSEPAVAMRVVVGRAAHTQTPLFAAPMKTIVFAPYWNVPRSILRGEILPKLANDPGYLASQNMEIVMGKDAIEAGVDPGEALASGKARVRQRPGTRNSLGRVKFLFPNRYDVYLHDTPSRSLFQRARRDFSHGCVRVVDPHALALWLLAPQGWDEARVTKALALSRETGVTLETPTDVVLSYATALARSDGTIEFREDIYRHDAALERALAGSYR